MQISDYLSIFAILISATSLYLSWLQFRKDRSQLKLKLHFQMDFSVGPKFMLEGTNIGRRVVIIDRIYARIKNGKRYPVSDRQKQLRENEQFDLSIPLEGFSGCFSDPDYIAAFEVEDTTGEKYSVKTRPLRKQMVAILKK